MRLPHLMPREAKGCRKSVLWGLMGLNCGRSRHMYKASQVALVVKNLPADAGDVRDVNSIPGSGRPLLEERHGNPLQYSCLENSLDGGAWRATVHRAAKSWTRPK